MNLRIKSEEAHKAAKRISEITGETLTMAVTKALEEKLEILRLQGTKRKPALRRAKKARRTGAPLK